jgi:hypothetical protein
VPLLVMLPHRRRAVTKPGQDAGSLDAVSIEATEDAARRRVTGRLR